MTTRRPVDAITSLLRWPEMERSRRSIVMRSIRTGNLREGLNGEGTNRQPRNRENERNRGLFGPPGSDSGRVVRWHRDRQSVATGKRVSGRVDIVDVRHIQKKQMSRK